jgi:pimeloyl-ACP methyl ester carboxylesterase
VTSTPPQRTATGLEPGAATYSAAPSRDVTPTAPDWFHAAMARPHDVGEVSVDGTPVRYLSWGPRNGPATVLVHGGAAHAMWWAPLASQLDPRRRVVAMDLSGHGLSGRRAEYSADAWGEEIVAVATATSEGPPTVIGHSLGGIVLSHVAHRKGDLFERIVLVDSPVWDKAPAPEGELVRVSGRPPRDHTHFATAVQRFRLVPPQECRNQWYVDHVAWHSLVQVEGGWRWRFDPEIFASPAGARQIVRFEGDLDAVGCPWAVVMGERSYLADGARRAFETHPDAPLRLVPDAAHHVMLDQPLALLATLQDLLTSWPRSRR